MEFGDGRGDIDERIASAETKLLLLENATLQPGAPTYRRQRRTIRIPFCFVAVAFVLGLLMAARAPLMRRVSRRHSWLAPTAARNERHTSESSHEPVIVCPAAAPDREGQLTAELVEQVKPCVRVTCYIC
jgi:hypothetical protein